MEGREGEKEGRGREGRRKETKNMPLEHKKENPFRLKY